VLNFLGEKIKVKIGRIFKAAKQIVRKRDRKESNKKNKKEINSQKKFLSLKNKNNGFSLLELLIVLAIMALLSAITAPSYQVYLKKGRASLVKGDLLILASKTESYWQQKTSYEGAKAKNIYSATSPINSDKALFQLGIEVQNKGTHYLLKGKAISGTEAEGDGVYWFNPIGRNCYFESAEAAYNKTCDGGSEWN
jgi:type IV pilus assembly protein PilE